jgi:hypothetical protein
VTQSRASCGIAGDKWKNNLTNRKRRKGKDVFERKKKKKKTKGLCD